MIEYENLGRLNEPFFTAYSEAFRQVLEGGWYILGEKVTQFEQQWASYCGCQGCVGVANGLDALTICLKALNLESGDEVIVPSNTYIATILAVLHAGLKPVLVEPAIDTYNIDPTRIEEKISSHTKAILVVHLYGKLCRMEDILQIARRNNLLVVEDCAQAHGASLNGKRAGSYGDFGAFSFYPTKNLGALGDAGAITSNNLDLLQEAAILRNYGSRLKYHNERVGYNSRLDELQAAFLSIKLQYLDRIVEHKRTLASLYLAGLKQDFIKPVVEEPHFDVYHIFNVRHPKRDQLKDYLFEQSIKTEIHYPIAPNKQAAMKGLISDQPTPVAEEIHQTTLSLPISYFHTTQQVERVIEVMNRF